MKLTKKNNEAKKLLSKFKKTDETLDNAELVCIKADGSKYDFNCFLFRLKFTEKVHNCEITLDEARNNQTELRILINKLSNDYNPRISKKSKREKQSFRICKKIVCERLYYCFFFVKGTFPYKGNVFKRIKEESEEELEKNKLEKIKNDYKKFIEYIENKSKSINCDLLKDYFDFVVPGALAKNYMRQKIKRKTMSQLKKIRINGLI